MFKKIKENEKVLKAKELWQNPKTHDIAVLLFWLIFIFVVIIVARGMGSTPSHTTETSSVNNFDSIKSYDFTYKTNDSEIVGQAYDDSLLFYINNKRYYYKNNLYLIDEKASLVNNYDLGVLKINSKMLNNLVSGITPSDINGFKQYIVPLDRFINLYEIDTDINLSTAATYNVVISVYLKDDEINKVVLDLTNYYKLKNNNINYPVTIYYYNINNVSDFTKGYDKMLEVK